MMGLLTGVLTLPLAPVRGLAWVAGQLQDEAESQLYDEDRIRAELLQLELDSEDGLVDEAERAVRENDLFERLAVADARRRAQLQTAAEMEHGDG
jgi:hypothetical protein